MDVGRRYLARTLMAWAQSTNLLVARSRMVVMPKAAFRCSASPSDTPWSAETGAAASSLNSLSSYALSRIFAMSAMGPLRGLERGIWAVADGSADDRPGDDPGPVDPSATSSAKSSYGRGDGSVEQTTGTQSARPKISLAAKGREHMPI